MNSYPPELLTQLAPVMFVAGLDVQTSTATITPSSPSTPTPPIPTPPKSQDPFQVLILRLRDALLAQRKVAIWQPEKNKTFQVVLVDTDVKFPPRKLVPSDDPSYSAAHSPLSPLTPTSPLHPDGLIAPIWIRKHTTLLPSVFVLFLRLYEHPTYASRSPLDLPDSEKEREREAEERRRDSELAADVAQRKKMTGERGIKLTVVLMASRRMLGEFYNDGFNTFNLINYLDDPALDNRLTFIRRQSALDSRAALFVLSPVSPAELNEFVRSLQQALYEPAVEYYTTHSKRVRRKRNRHSQGISGYPNATTGLGGLNIARPLRPEGWTVRYEYKMACFAEFRSEDEVALKHYQDAYETLTIMFGSTAMLPPRTKRWAEAKVLADCINLKIVKLYLYNNEHALALSHHNSHIRQFGDFSRGWGIGEETFEFWSWVARQHRVLAELLEQGTRSSLVLPAHKPLNSLSGLTPSQQNLRASGLDYDSVRALGLNPSQAMQHPGYYYYMAAKCTELRRERFLAALEAEAAGQPIVLSPGFTNEKKVEHLAIVNELYTKAYELFKKHSPASSQGQGRLTLWIAYRIAQTYYDAGKFDMAVRFFERIAKTYRREKWNQMLHPLLSTWYSCAQRLGDVELSIKLLIEMLGHDIADPDEPSALEEDLIAVLKSTVPTSSEEALVVHLEEARPIFEVSSVFWSQEVEIDDQAAFQLSLTSPRLVTISSIPFSKLTVKFSDTAACVVVNHDPTAPIESKGVRRVDLGPITGPEDEEEDESDEDESEASTPHEVKANLRWEAGETIIFTGSIHAKSIGTLKIESVVATIEENGWRVEVPLDLTSTEQNARWLGTLNPPRFIAVRREDPHSTLVKHRPHRLKISFQHQSPAYLDEDYPIDILVTNEDTQELETVLNVLLQPTVIDDVVNWIEIDGERSSGLIRGIFLGALAPGEKITKTIHLFNTGAAGDRSIDVSIQTRATSATSKETPPSDSETEDAAEQEDKEQEADHDTMEHLKMITVPTRAALVCNPIVQYNRSLESSSSLANLNTFDDTFWDGACGGEAMVAMKLQCTVPAGAGLRLESVSLERANHERAKVLECSADEVDEDVYPGEFIEGDEVCELTRISFAGEDEEDFPEEIVPGPGRFVVEWSRINKSGAPGSLTKSYFPLPPLKPPKDTLVALFSIPPVLHLHTPQTITLTLRNMHPSRSANVTIHLEPESLDGSWVVSGVRSGRVPLLLPRGGEEKVIWKIVPIECGWIKPPRVRVVDRRKPVGQGGVGSQAGAVVPAGTQSSADAGEVVKVIDVRYDVRREAEGGAHVDGEQGPGLVLVLP
ncbi:hypothetical protein CVT24_005968 [Panaeolus cyanescens]|uniref:Trafficking protein particle complex subunit 11 n=1 Tax=Panaeolus cyanescens TaxID=181874 RepID=A0A409V8U5_9AGAR|nr:hypothetical protein CVT24_005968 [Panaeolus cyanescens]